MWMLWNFMDQKTLKYHYIFKSDFLIIAQKFDRSLRTIESYKNVNQNPILKHFLGFLQTLLSRYIF